MRLLEVTFCLHFPIEALSELRNLSRDDFKRNFNIVDTLKLSYRTQRHPMEIVIGSFFIHWLPLADLGAIYSVRYAGNIITDHQMKTIYTCHIGTYTSRLIVTKFMHPL